MLDTENLVILSGRAIMDSRKEKELEFCTRGMVLAFFYSYTLSNTFVIILFEIIFEISFQFIKATKGGRRGK